jgi:hypothetical protein
MQSYTYLVPQESGAIVSILVQIGLFIPWLCVYLYCFVKDLFAIRSVNSFNVGVLAQPTGTERNTEILPRFLLLKSCSSGAKR